MPTEKGLMEVQGRARGRAGSRWRRAASDRRAPPRGRRHGATPGRRLYEEGDHRSRLRSRSRSRRPARFFFFWNAIV